MSFSLPPIHDNVIFGHVMIVSERERDKKVKIKLLTYQGHSSRLHSQLNKSYITDLVDDGVYCGSLSSGSKQLVVRLQIQCNIVSKPGPNPIKIF